MPFSLLFFLLFSLSNSVLSSITHNRRTLHQPFLPAPPPATQPPSPEYPSITTPLPFFPSYSGPPPPQATYPSSIPTFPANLSSVAFPDSHSSRHRSSKLLPAVLLPLLALSLLSLSLALLLHRRRRSNKPLRSDSHNGSSRKPPSCPAVSEFLYLGTLVSSRRYVDGVHEDPPSSASSSDRKLASPELRPLPPLSRHGNAGGGCSSDEEFYSPRGSSSGKDSSRGMSGAPMSGPETTFQAVEGKEKLEESRSPTLSTPSYPSSNTPSSPAPSSPAMSSPANRWSPERSKVKSCNSGSDSGGVGEIGSRTLPPPPPPPPPPPALLRLLTLSAPKRKPPSPSRVSEFSGNNMRPLTTIGDFPHNPFASGQSVRQPAPPPPPPLPPAGFWQSRVPRLKASPPPDFVIPNSIGMKESSTAAVLAAEQPENSGAAEETPLPKLKPLHWDKVRASSNREMVWDQLKSSSFQVNEEMIETLFMCNNENAAPKETTRRQVLLSPNQENKVLDPKKSHNIEILLRALNVTKEEVCEALLEGNTESLGTELLETLLKMAPSKEEELKLKEYEDDTPVKLGQAEKFLKAVLDIPFAFKRMDAMLYIANFDSEVNYLKKSFETLEAACEELRSNRLFLKLLDAVLKTGNRMNVGTNRGDAHAFKLDTLLKLVDVKGTDVNTTLLHFVVQEIIRSEGSRLSAANSSPSRTQTNILRDDLECKKLGLQAVAVLGRELSNVRKAAAMDSDVLRSYVSKLAGGIGKVNEVLRLNSTHCEKETGKKFQETISGFLSKAEDEIIKVQAQESVASSLVKEITEYFHGNSTKEEAHPFRIFMVVRDFLSILDKVCKEVGRINDTSFVSSARQFPLPVNPTLPPLFPRLHALRPESSDDESSSSLS